MKIIMHIIRKEFLQLRRDKRMLALSIIAPVIQLILLGYAATTDVRDIPMLLVDQDKSSVSREFVDQFLNSGYFVLKGEVGSTKEIDRSIDNGTAWIAMVIPSDFSRNILANRTAAVQVIADGSDGNSANISIGYVTQIIGRYSQKVVAEISKSYPGSGIPGVISPEVRVWFNPELKSRNFMIPAVLALVLLIITMTLTSIAIVKERENGTLEQLIVTPIKPHHLILGKLLPFTIIGALDTGLVILVAYGWFGVPLRGSVFLLFGISGLFVLTTLGLGLFVSTISKTQQQAMMTAQFFFFMPFIFFSGFTFPIENMPEVIQYLTYLIPLRYYIIIIRGIFLKGVGIAELWPQAAILLFFGIAILSLSVLRFRKRLA